MLIAWKDFTADAVGFDTKSGERVDQRFLSKSSPYPTTRRRRHHFQYYFGLSSTPIMRSCDGEAGKSSPWAWSHQLDRHRFTHQRLQGTTVANLSATTHHHPDTDRHHQTDYPATPTSLYVERENAGYSTAAQRDKTNAIPTRICSKKQQAVMELYKKCGVSPMGSRIPILIQMPVLIAMFRFLPASSSCAGKHFLWLRTSLPMTVSCNCPLKSFLRRPRQHVSPCSGTRHNSSTRA